MRKILAGVIPGIALLGLAACDNTDTGTTGGMEGNGAQTEQPADDTGTAEPADPGAAAPETDTGTGTGTSQ